MTDNKKRLALRGFILGGAAAVVALTSCGKKDDRTEVRYSLEASGYPQKDKKAVLRKEEGEWKIEAVTDDN